MKEIIEKLIQLTQDDEIEWRREHEELDAEIYIGHCEKLSTRLKLSYDDNNFDFSLLIGDKYINAEDCLTVIYLFDKVSIKKEEETPQFDKFVELLNNYDDLVQKEVEVFGGATETFWKLPDE